jgi:hypothetical protein
MYTKQEVSRQKQAFWTTFGHYMQPVVPADGLKVNWVNYKTGINGISFKMDADKTTATITIVMAQPDLLLQEQHYEQLLLLKTMLHHTLGEEWQWHKLQPDEYGRVVSTIGTELTNANILRNEDWPLLVSFFKPRIIALDEFWTMARYSF